MAAPRRRSPQAPPSKPAPSSTTTSSFTSVRRQLFSSARLRTAPATTAGAPDPGSSFAPARAALAKPAPPLAAPAVRQDNAHPGIEARNVRDGTESLVQRDERGEVVFEGEVNMGMVPRGEEGREEESGELSCGVLSAGAQLTGKQSWRRL